jgi:hypothetical protein
MNTTPGKATNKQPRWLTDLAGPPVRSEVNMAVQPVNAMHRARKILEKPTVEIGPPMGWQHRMGCGLLSKAVRRMVDFSI